MNLKELINALTEWYAQNNSETWFSVNFSVLTHKAKPLQRGELQFTIHSSLFHSGCCMGSTPEETWVNFLEMMGPKVEPSLDCLAEVCDAGSA